MQDIIDHCPLMCDLCPSEPVWNQDPNKTYSEQETSDYIILFIMFRWHQVPEGLLACWNALVPEVLITDNAGPEPMFKIPKANYFAISIFFLFLHINGTITKTEI